MNALSRLRIAARLGIGFGLQLFLIAGIVVATWVYLGRISSEGDSLLKVESAKVAAVNRIDTLTRSNARATMELFFADAGKRQEIRGRIAANKGAIDEAIEVLDRLVVLEEGKRLLADVKRTRSAYVASFQKIPPMLDAGQRDEASALLTQETLPLLDQLQAPITALLTLQEKVAASRGAAMQGATTAATRATVLLGLTSLALGLSAAWFLSQSIVMPLRSAIDLAGRIAHGDLGNRIVITGKDETAELLGALEAMQNGLRDLVGQVRGGVEEVSSASSQISAANLDLSARTESQASALEETAASMEQLTGAISNNAENAREANRLAVGASTTARSGGEVVGNVVSTMHAVNESSQRIREIIGVIDGIAFQTNLLALNAAVEAARAGEEGRGFAVVAGEVRALASRSADAARQIKSLIDQSVARAEEGSRLADRAGQAMTEVVGAIERVSSIVGDISAATTEQQAGVSQVGQAVTQLDEATQQNAALVEETAAASKSLDEQARQLVAAISVFRTGDPEAHRGSRARYMPRATASLAHEPEHPNAWE